MKREHSKVLILGGSSGIGLALAQAIKAQGGEPVVVGRNQAKLEATGFRSLVADITKEADVARIFAEPVDHVVVTAVTVGYGPIATMDEATMRAVIDGKLMAALFVAKHAKINPGGSITFTSGINKDRPIRGSSVTTAVNGALGAFAKAMALELAPTRVNCVSPGWVETPVWDALMGEKKTTAWADTAKKLPVGRIGQPADLAQAFMFLMENEFTTGTTLHVDGGHALV